MLVTLESILPHAFAGKYAVGAFNVYNVESAQGVLAAAEKEHSPVIMQTSEKALDYAGFETLTQMILGMAKRSTVPVVVHLDHGRSVEVAKACLAAGYTSVMLDCSHLPFDENVAKTQEVVAMAKKHHASVESELGTVAGREDYINHKFPTKTDPQQALEFIQKTHINCLAVGIGNAHGPTTQEEHLDFDLLKTIQETVKYPLVLHGASGNSEHDIHTAISLGVVKINIDTDLRMAFSAAVRGYLRSHSSAYDPREILGMGRDAVMAKTQEKIRLFKSKGKA